MHNRTGLMLMLLIVSSSHLQAANNTENRAGNEKVYERTPGHKVERCSSSVENSGAPMARRGLPEPALHVSDARDNSPRYYYRLKRVEKDGSTVERQWSTQNLRSEYPRMPLSFVNGMPIAYDLTREDTIRARFADERDRISWEYENLYHDLAAYRLLKKELAKLKKAGKVAAHESDSDDEEVAPDRFFNRHIRARFLSLLEEDAREKKENKQIGEESA